MSRRREFKCICCGKYVSYKDIDDKKVIVEFTPDTVYTSEKCEMYHIKCKEKK